MFGTDMNNEYLQLHYQLGFSLQELFNLGLNAVNSSFLSEKSKSKMRRSFMKTYDSILDEE
jgi:adenosine deaminase